MHRPYKNRRGNFRRGGSHQGSGERNQSTDEKTATPRHPPHLKGREIGLYYASLAKKSPNKEKRAEKINLDWRLITGIRELLARAGPVSEESANTWKEKYESLSESRFKDNFLKTLKANDSTHFANHSENFNLDSSSPSHESQPLDQKLLDEFLTKVSKPEYKQLLTSRSKLPIFSHCEAILKTVEENQVIVICGETGCGKTTQVVQFLLDDALRSSKGSKFQATCTQPRRIAATSVAQRVAQERCESCGNGSVGYQIRLECRKPRDHGSILFCTTGILVQYLQSDPYLQNVSHLLIDEVHERDVLTDFLLTIVRDLLPKRRGLRVILMSATINAKLFSDYFNGCPVLNVKLFFLDILDFPTDNLNLFLGLGKDS